MACGATHLDRVPLPPLHDGVEQLPRGLGHPEGYEAAAELKDAHGGDSARPGPAEEEGEPGRVDQGQGQQSRRNAAPPKQGPGQQRLSGESEARRVSVTWP